MSISSGSSGASGMGASSSSSSVCGAQATPTSRPHLACVAEVRECASHPFGRLVHDHVAESAVDDCTGKRGAWTQLLKLRKTAGVDAGHVPQEDPRLSFSDWVGHVVQSCWIVVVVAQAFSDVT